MSHTVLMDLDHNRKRLNYYLQLKTQFEIKNSNSYPASIDKWIEIYSERIRKLENQANKLGLKTQFKTENSTAEKKLASA